MAVYGMIRVYRDTLRWFTVGLLLFLMFLVVMVVVIVMVLKKVIRRANEKEQQRIDAIRESMLRSPNIRTCLKIAQRMPRSVREIILVPQYVYLNRPITVNGVTSEYIYVVPSNARALTTDELKVLAHLIHSHLPAQEFSQPFVASTREVAVPCWILRRVFPKLQSPY